MIVPDEDDDTHFCLKCHSTIIGLDNYVNHRKNNCKNDDLQKSPLPSQLLPHDETFSLKADDFFSSLELQSSSKKPSQSGKNFNGILTRSKTANIQASSKDEKDQTQTLTEITYDTTNNSNKDYLERIKSSSLQTPPPQSSSSSATAVTATATATIEKIVYDESEDESPDESDYDDDESLSDEDAPPRNHTGGKWKPSSPIDWGQPPPPPTFTGGKWKPSTKRSNSPPPPNHTKGKWKPSFPQSIREEDYCISPPTTTTTTTGGKSKEFEKINKNKHHQDNSSNIYDLNKPSPNYTKGKWLPSKSTNVKIIDDSPFRKSNGTIQYWCRPCNRRLASKIVYERHLKSELHSKRTFYDKDFDDGATHTIERSEKRKKNLNLKKITTKGTTTSETLTTLTTTPTTTTDTNTTSITSTDTVTTITTTISTTTSTTIGTIKIKKRNRKKIFFRCEVCRSKVNRILIGKHLISHYHCRRGDTRSELAKNIVLDNIHSIILQCPFQCGQCKFYFNFHEDFLNHWLSKEHNEKDSKCPGYFWCPFCKYQTESNRDMYQHLITKEHNEVVSVINRSVPIIVKKLITIKCVCCDKEFFLNRDLLKHSQEEEHYLNFANQHFCGKCNQMFRSNISLKRHLENVHKEIIFICTPCNKLFKTKEEVKGHRNSSQHRLVLSGKSLEKKCLYCGKIFINFSEYKNHIRSVHPEHCSRCPTCGKNFAAPQELTSHLRSKSCKVIDDILGMNYFCDKCLYSSNSTSELLFHQTLHTEPLIINGNDDKQLKKKKPVLHYKCPLCGKFFPKSSLQAHLRIHTEERPFVCQVCNKAFVRKNNWLCHLRNHEKKGNSKSKRKKVENSRPFLCSTCGASFKRKFILEQHMIVHSGKLYKCLKENCIFSARTISELKVHYQTHSDEKNFHCNICDYKGKTKQQLVRHLTIHDSIRRYQCTKCSFTARTSSHLKRHNRTHTGTKPYSCPYCKYKCNNLENLRKHILLTGKHPGKFIYECKFCTNTTTDIFRTNFARDFKAHLGSQHTQIFNDTNELTSYIAGIYDAEESPDEESINKPKLNNVSKLLTQIKEDPIVASCSSIKEEHCNDEIFSMYNAVVPKDSDNIPETWNLTGSFDVEESGVLVSFTNVNEVLFDDNF